MSDVQGWYARKMGQQPRQQPAPPPPQQGQWVLPGRPPQQQYQQPQFQPQYQQQPQPQYQQPTQAVQFAGHVYTGVENYHGGIAQQLNPDACPGCGGNQYFAKVRTKGRGPDPAGHCFNCGYNELFDQGDQGNWGGSGVVLPSGEPVQAAAIQVNSSPWAAGIARAE